MMKRGVGFLLRMRWGALALGAAVFVLALPARASSATSRRGIQLYTAAVKAHGVQIALNAGEGPFGVTVVKCGGRCRFAFSGKAMSGSWGRNEARLAEAAAQPEPSRGADYIETDMFSFGAGITYRSTQNLSSAHVSGRFVRHLGSVNMTFHATKAATRIAVPKECTGTPGRKRRGVLKGMLHFRAGRVGTLTVRSFRATLEIPARIVKCSYPPPSRATHFVSVSTEEGPFAHATIIGAQRLKRGAVFEGVAVNNFPQGATWGFLDVLSVGALPSADYTYAPNLSTGTITGGGPLDGTANYTGTPKGTGKSSHGTLGGDLTAHFATLGTVRLFPHGAVKAQQREY